MNWIKVETALPPLDELVFVVVQTYSWDGELIQIYGTSRRINNYANDIVWLNVNTFEEAEKITHWCKIEVPND